MLVFSDCHTKNYWYRLKRQKVTSQSGVWKSKTLVLAELASSEASLLVLWVDCSLWVFTPSSVFALG
jgi:hypothetical protein